MLIHLSTTKLQIHGIWIHTLCSPFCCYGWSIPVSDFTGEFHQTFKEKLMPIFLNPSKRTEQKGIHQDSFYKTSIILLKSKPEPQQESKKTTTIKSSREKIPEDKKTQTCLEGGKLLEDGWLEQFTWNYSLQRRRKWQPSPVFLSGESPGQRSLVGYSPWDSKSRTRLSD